MNLLLLQPHQLLDNNRAILSSAQAQHVVQVLKLQVGDLLRIGLVNGNIGNARLLRLAPEIEVVIETLDQQPPPQLPLTLILALPRPQMIKRILQTIACMGVQKLCLLQTAKVEKSFWQSPSVSEAAIQEHLLLGLEQGMATQLPEVTKHTRFRPFAEDELASLSHGSNKIIAHPGAYPPCPAMHDRATVLAVGPEGGFTEKEVDSFLRSGFNPVQLGPRILKVETAVTALLAKLSL